MSAVVRTEECPRRSEMVGRSTPLSASWLAWLWRRTWSDAPLGRPAVLQIRDTVADTEFGFRGVPSGLAKIRSRSARYRGPNCARNSFWRSRWRSRTGIVDGGKSTLRGRSVLVSERRDQVPGIEFDFRGDDLRGELDGLLASRSWRMTAFLRRIGGRLKTR